MTFAEAGALTLSEVNRLFTHWKKYPPVRDLVAAAVGFKPSDKPPAPQISPQELAAIIAASGGRKPVALAASKYVTPDEARAQMATTGRNIPGGGVPKRGP